MHSTNTADRYIVLCSSLDRKRWNLLVQTLNRFNFISTSEAVLMSIMYYTEDFNDD